MTEKCEDPGKRPTPLLEFQNITVYRNDRKVLDSVSVTICEGECIAILGPNGSGKSSFVKTITREYYPVLEDSKLVFRIQGKEVWDIFDLRSLFGIVSNDLQSTFARDLEGREVILSGFFSSLGLYNRCVTPLMERRADEILEFLEIGHLGNRRMTEMSSGEARKFLIGRALIHNPRVLILDEPTNSLDMHALHHFHKTLRKIARSGTGIILVTHTLQDIIPEITRVILVKDGRFVLDGQKEDVLTDKKMGELFSIPATIRRECGYYYTVGD
ncbi:MAG: ATP-binding cassette domain-containing protein [Methanoregula sp.]|nr:ATP-binding cassette domain-containing protein [Methanoregula sp.]